MEKGYTPYTTHQYFFLHKLVQDLDICVDFIPKEASDETELEDPRLEIDHRVLEHMKTTPTLLELHHVMKVAHMGVGPPRQPHCRGPCGPPRLAGPGCVQTSTTSSHASRAESALLPQLLLASRIHLS